MHFSIVLYSHTFGVWARWHLISVIHLSFILNIIPFSCQLSLLNFPNDIAWDVQTAAVKSIEMLQVYAKNKLTWWKKQTFSANIILTPSVSELGQASIWPRSAMDEVARPPPRIHGGRSTNTTRISSITRSASTASTARISSITCSSSTTSTTRTTSTTSTTTRLVLVWCELGYTCHLFLHVSRLDARGGSPGVLPGPRHH